MKLTEGWHGLNVDTKKYNWNFKHKKIEKVNCGEDVITYKLNKKQLEEYLNNIDTREINRR